MQQTVYFVSGFGAVGALSGSSSDRSGGIGFESRLQTAAVYTGLLWRSLDIFPSAISHTSNWLTRLVRADC